MKKELTDAFMYGVDHGLLIAEQEREQEEWADAFQGHIIDIKYSMPSHRAPTRQLHSKEWFAAKEEAYEKFVQLYAQACQKNNY